MTLISVACIDLIRCQRKKRTYINRSSRHLPTSIVLQCRVQQTDICRKETSVETPWANSHPCMWLFCHILCMISTYHDHPCLIHPRYDDYYRYLINIQNGPEKVRLSLVWSLSFQSHRYCYSLPASSYTSITSHSITCLVLSISLFATIFSFCDAKNLRQPTSLLLLNLQ